MNSIANKSNYILYKDSILAQYLKDILCENYNILLLYISPNVKDLSEGISTLQFGENN